MELVPQAPPAEGRGWARRIAALMLRRKGRFALALFAAVMSMGATSVLPLLPRAIVNDVVSVRKTASGSSHLVVARHGGIGLLIAGLIVLGVFQFGFAYLRRYSAGQISLGVDYELRTSIFDHLQRLDFARHDDLQTGQLVSRASSDVNLVQNLLMLLPITASNILQFAISLVIALFLSPLLTVVVLLCVPAIGLVSWRMRQWTFASSWDAQQRTAELAGVVEEAVYGVRVVKAFGQEQRELDRLEDRAEVLYGTRMRNIRIVNRYQPILSTIPTLGEVAILALGGYLVYRGELSLGTFLAFNIYLAQLVAPARSLANFSVQAQNARAGAERIFELLDSTPTVSDRPGAEKAGGIDRSVELRDVSFGYLRSKPILCGLDLRIQAGETVALVGAAGSGKSTISLLLPRFYDVQSGAVLIDGRDVRDLTTESLRTQIGVVFEESFLFSDTVRANIAFARPGAADVEVEAAARAAGAQDFIAALPDGYETVVGERGYTLSGGQRQRIALARALITRPSVLVLDDATSSIDARTEEDIHRTLRQLLPGRTTILIAHRRSTLDLASRIVVIDEGRVLDSGTHEELQGRCALYRRLLSGPEDSSLDELGEEDDLAAAGPGVVTASAWIPPDDGDARGLALPASARVREALQRLPPVIDHPLSDPRKAAQPVARFSLATLFGPYRRRLIGALLLAVGDTVAGTLVGPYLIKSGVDRGATNHALAVVWLAATAYLVFTLADLFINRVENLYTGRTAQELLYSLRIRIFAHLQRLGMDYYEREMAGRVLTRMGSDVEAFQSLFQNGVINGVISLLQLAGGCLIFFIMSVRLALLVMIIMVPLAIGTQWFRRRSERAYLNVRERIAAVNANLQENISGVRVSQAYNREGRNMSEFHGLAGAYRNSRQQTIRLQSMFFPFVNFLEVAAQALVLAYGTHLLLRGQISAGALLAFILYIDQVFDPVQQMSQIFDSYQQAKAAMTKIRELMATPVSTPVLDRPTALPERLTGDIRLENLRFRYPQGVDDALRGVDLHIPAGSSLALVGETGSGKSTIVKLVARYYDPSGGRLLVDGLDLTGVDLTEYRHQLGIVPQEAFLFGASIRDNIAYGRPGASGAEVEWAARTMGAHDFITRLPGGYHHVVTERGRSLSIGQRQLIALSRAYLVNPAILLLDEATSNLDLSTEARVTRAMRQVSSGRTTILIAHRLQTARYADRIAVVDAGRIVEHGTHEELLTAGGLYQALWSSYNLTRQAV
jgi:ATP-binding cassette, subfamily B, bacterial